MHTPDEQHLELARHLVASSAGIGAGAVERFTAGMHAFDTLFTCLAPIVGSAGVRSIFLRSAKLTARRFDGVTRIVEALQGKDTLLGGGVGRAALLTHDELGEDPGVAVETVTTLLATFLGLLMALVGEALTLRLVSTAWPGLPGPTRAQETK